MKKIAPTLQAYIAEESNWRRTANVPELRAELRALLSVARAAKRVAVSGFDWDGDMVRALDRLDKVSGTTKKGTK
jgi:hypothetical protein